MLSDVIRALRKAYADRRDTFPFALLYDVSISRHTLSRRFMLHLVGVLFF